MSKHSIATVIDGERINAQVKEADKAEFYASDEWDHEYCGPGDTCGAECSYAE